MNGSKCINNEINKETDGEIMKSFFRDIAD